MKHHFGDLLDRTGDYWTIIPNRERFAFIANIEIVNKYEVRILTISKSQNKKHWEQIFDCPNLEELTLHEPSKEQVQAIRRLSNIKRLRVTFFRAADIEFIGDLVNLEELILEYVSGFSDLTPLSRLEKLKSLHMENLRGVSKFDGLRGISGLRYLHIDGTLDWNQPIEDFNFLEGLQNLEVFSLGCITNKTEFPALLPILHLTKLKKITIKRSCFITNEYAFLKAAFPEIEGCDWDLCWDYYENYEFLGKKAGFVKKANPIAKKRCEEFEMMFNRMLKESEIMIKNYSHQQMRKS